MLPVRLQRDINRYYISFISQVIANNVFLAQITQIRKFGPTPLTISVLGVVLFCHVRAVHTLTTRYQPVLYLFYFSGYSQ